MPNYNVKQFLLNKFNNAEIRMTFNSYEPMNIHQEKFQKIFKECKKQLDNLNTYIYNVCFGINTKIYKVKFNEYKEKLESIKNNKSKSLELKVLNLRKICQLIKNDIKNLSYSELYAEDRWKDRCGI